MDALIAALGTRLRSLRAVGHRRFRGIRHVRRRDAGPDRHHGDGACSCRSRSSWRRCPALGAIVTATAMAIFAGDIPAAMLRIPGTPASAAYTDESYAMSKKGQLDLNLGVNLVFSVLGGLVGVAILIVCAPALAEVAINFSSFEYFWLALLGLTCAVFIATDAPLKGFVSLLFGLAINCIGIDPAAGFPRFTFGSVELLQGISFIPAMIGMFAVSELLRGVVSIDQTGAVLTQKIGNIFVGVWTRLQEILAQFPARLGHRRTDRRAARRRRRHRGVDFLCGLQAILERAGKIRHRPYRGHRRRNVGQQFRARRRVDSRPGVRHPRRFDHRDRDRRALHERHESRADACFCRIRNSSTRCFSSSFLPTC